MKKASFPELIDIDTLRKMAESLYEAAGVPIGILGTDGEVLVKAGWQDICVNFHRKNPLTCERCHMSDRYINDHISEQFKTGEYVAYKCKNNLWDIGIPIIISGEHIATIFLGQFFYDDELINVEFFRLQATEFGFDENEYLNALRKVPSFSKEKVKSIIQYYTALVNTLAESGLRQLKNEKFQIDLQKSQEYINKVFNSVNDGIFIHGVDGEIIDINKTAISMFGYTRDELLGMNIMGLISQNSPISGECVVKMLKDAENEQPQMFELLGINKSGEEFWIEVNLFVTKIGDYNRSVSDVRNITDRKKAELELQNKAIQMEKIRTEFFANISHELRTPLNIILGSIQIIGMMINDNDKPIDTNKIKNSLNIEKQNCLRLLRLINNLIDSNKLESGDLDIDLINCNIVNLVEDITLSVAEYVKNNDLTLVFDTDVEEKTIACDLDKIERIMLNLLSNAVKFTNPGGSIFVNIFDGEEYLTITVEDTGIGIPDDKLDIIFDRFKQVDKSFTRSHEGSGIGLSIVKFLVEMHQGTVSVESKYGEGTKFVVRLPVRTADTEDDINTKKLPNGIIDDHVERIKFEFSDICNE